MVGICPSSNLYEVPVSGYCIEGKLRLPAAEIVVTSDQAARMQIAAAAVIDTELGVVAAAAQTDGNLTCSRSGIAVPDVWTGHTVAGTIELCVFGVESQIRHIAYEYCVHAVIVKQSVQPVRWVEIANDTYYSRASADTESTDFDQVLVTGCRKEGDFGLPATGIIIALDHITLLWIALRSSIDC
jgi:hypothetical protein